MSGKRFWIAVLVVVALSAALAAAQNEKNEVSGEIGRTFISTQHIQDANYFDPNIRFGRGLSVEGSYARRFFVLPVYSLTAEVPVLFDPDEHLHSGGPGLAPKEYKSVFVTPGARVNLFPTTAFSPWASVGVGFGHISENSETLYSLPNPGKGTTSAVVEYGFGLDVRVMRRLYIRGAARDYWSGSPDFPLTPTGKSRQNNYFVGGGAMWRF